MDFKGLIIEGLSAVLIDVGHHLPFVGIAVGSLGYMLKAFTASNEADEQLQTIKVWMAAINEWWG